MNPDLNQQPNTAAPEPQPFNPPPAPAATPLQYQGPVQPAVPPIPQPTPVAAPYQSAAATPTPSPVQPTQAVYGSGAPTGGYAPIPPTPRSAKKKKLIIAGAASSFVAVLLVTGTVFGLYIPNKPENVYKTAMSRTGKTVDKLVETGTDEKKLNAFANTELTGSAELTVPDGKYTGSFGTKYDADQSDNTFKFTGESQSIGKQDVSLQVLTDIPADKTFPDVYFKYTGLASSGLEGLLPQLKDYEGKWITASSDYLKSLVPAEEQSQVQKNEFGQKEASELARIASSMTREYVFTSDTDKAVMVPKKFVGTEKMEGDIRANHYEVGINKANAKKYCKALIEGFMNAPAYKKIPGISVATIDKDRDQAVKDCEKDADDEIKDNEVFDMWVDKKLKLIHKIRFTQENEPDTYIEVGQTYKKGDSIPLFVSYHSGKDKSDAKMTLDVDVEKSITKGTFTYKYNGDGDQKYDLKSNFEFKPHNGDVKIDAPKDGIPIQQVIDALNNRQETFTIDQSSI